jgi:hypothetical protein
VWIVDDSYRTTIHAELQPLAAEIRDAVLHTPTNKKSAREISDALSSEPTNLYLKVICSSKTTW